MIDFEARKEKNIFNSISQREDPILTTEQTKIINDISIKNNNQIKNIWNEINNLKFQISNILKRINRESLGQENNSNILNKEKNNNIIKEELFDYINKEIKILLKENIKLLPFNYNLNQSANYINNDLNQKNNINHNIKNRNNENENKKKNYQGLNNEISITSSKLNMSQFNDQNDLINNTINNFNKKEIWNNYNIENNINEDDIKEKNINFNQDDLNIIKKNIFENFEKFNLKILNELKNQACDIKTLYEEIQNFSNNRNIKSELTTINNDYKSEINNMNKIEYKNLDNINSNLENMSNLIYMIEEELSKKVDLEQLNYALKAQSKLNEALTSSIKICRFSWDTEDILINNKYIKWSIQNINTALDVFNWENNSEKIRILQKGVYKILVGLIGLENNKNIIINIRNNYIENNYEKNINNDNINLNIPKNKYNENLFFIEKYIACTQDTEIKILLVDKNNNRDYSEEAFLELKKII